LHHAIVFAFSTRSFCSPRLARSRPEAALAVGGHRIAAVPGAGIPRPWTRPSPPLCSLGQGGLGPKPKPGRRACFPARALGPKAIAGRLASLGRPVSDKKNGFSFFFYYLKMEWFGKGLTTQICSKFVEINFARFLIIISTWKKYCMSSLKYFSVEFLFNQ
jgi:hypothetical protein